MGYLLHSAGPYLAREIDAPDAAAVPGRGGGATHEKHETSQAF
jgi:hypothetical protein